VNPAYISAISVLCGSAIGALASLVTPRLANRHEHEMRRRRQENDRRERIFLEFIDLASNAFVDALVHTSIEKSFKARSALRRDGQIAAVRVRGDGRRRRKGDEPGDRDILRAEAGTSDEAHDGLQFRHPSRVFRKMSCRAAGAFFDRAACASLAGTIQTGSCSAGKLI
jgi:hypothetical protein